MPYAAILIVICCATFYYRLGESEYGSGGLLALISVALWLIGVFAWHFAVVTNLLPQVALFFALTGWNVLRSRRR